MKVARYGPQPAWKILAKQRSTAMAAMKLGVTYGCLRGALMGYSAPSREIRIGLSEMLGLPVEELFTPQALAAVPRQRKTAESKLAS